MRLSKKQRWTIYVTLIVGFIVGGWYLTATERPDSYTPRDAAEDAPYADPDVTDPAAGDPDDETNEGTRDDTPDDAGPVDDAEPDDQ